MTKEFSFDDGAKLQVEFEGTAGVSSLTISADPNLTGVNRSLDLNFYDTNGTKLYCLHITQGIQGQPLRVTVDGSVRVTSSGSVRVTE